METCKAPNCSNPVFSSHFCKYHQFMRHMKGGDLYVRKAKKKPVEPRSPAKGTKIPKESKKRLVEHKYYRQIKEELRAEMVANGTYNCFFSGQPMGDHFEFHHLVGRDGTYYTDPKYLVPALRQPHDDYHHKTVGQLLKESWYQGFLSRLKQLDPKLYEKELKKQFKAGLFDDDN